MQRCFGEKPPKEREGLAPCLRGAHAFACGNGLLLRSPFYRMFFQQVYAVLFSRCLEYIWGSSGQSRPSKSKRDTHIISATSHFKYSFFFFFFPAQLHMYVHLKLDIFITELTHFPELKIRVSLTICSCKCEW